MSSDDGGFPLSFAQEQLWFLDQLREGSSEYLLHWGFRLRGDLDVDALSVALAQVAARHEVLRTRYDTVEGAPVQVVDEPGPVDLTVTDLTGLAHAAQRQRIEELGASGMAAPMDLRARPPWRIHLVRLAASEWLLLVAVHHIAFDGWSWDVLAHELGALYAGHVAGEPAALDPVPVQYVDFAEWQRAWWDTPGAPRERQLRFWRERLADLAPLDLPTDRPRPAQWNPRGDRVELVVPPEVAAVLTTVGRDRGATPFMVYLAAFQLLLARYSGHRDVAVGVSLSGRGQVELERLVGLFLNTVVMRTDLSGEPSFAELLARVREVTLDAQDNQDVPFDWVVADLAPERDPARNPVFQVGFALHDSRGAAFTLPGIDIEELSPSWASSAFDLSLHLVERADGSLTGWLLYPTALFDRPRIERMAAHYVQLLTTVAAVPDVSVNRLELVSEREIRQFVEWNRTGTGAAAECLPELFARQALATPDAVAVVSESGELTYAALAATVDGLAGCLRSRGVTTEVPVGVAMRRGEDLVIALLAVLAAGGVFVPLPLEHPAERLAGMLDDAGVDLVLTESAVRELVPGGVRVVAVDELADEIRRRAPADLPKVDAANAAYVMFTSGSTGRPKGVVVTHGGIGNRVRWSVDRYRMTPADRVLQKTNIGFDAAMWEFLAPLVSGGAVVVAPQGAHGDPTAIVRAVREYDVTVLQLVPSVLRLVVDEPELTGCATLRLVCSAGEPLAGALGARLLDRIDVELFNTYGPTECSIDSTAWPFTDGAHEIVPIGLPLPNVEVFVVDDADQLVPVGVPGELCVAGAGLARGYAGRADLTAERFTPNPFAGEPGERWYRTGDLVRRRSDGVLEFVGRLDDQVKIRGVRVEPGEVEAAVGTHPSVAAAVVTTYRTESGDLELVAYAVPADGDPVRPEDIRVHVGTRLPRAMIPSTVVSLESLPLTGNGKLDRAALPSPTTAGRAEVGHVAPAAGTEQAIAEIMADVLGVDQVGATDDFFTLGGHSLLAIRLVLRLRRAFDVELTVAEVFEAPTVAALATVVDEGTQDLAAPAIRPVPRTNALPLSFAQQRLWFLDRLEPASVEYLIPLAMRLPGLDVTAFRRALDAVAARHEVLRTRYRDTGDGPVQLVSPPGEVEFELVDLTGVLGAERTAQEIVDRASRRPFDLEHEHPLRVTVVRIGGEDHLVAITLHHIAFDAWSMGIFLRDLDTAYRAFVDGRVPRLGAPAVQYADFAAWQRDRQSGPELARQVDYWRDRLGGMTPVELPADRPRAALRDPRGDTVTVEVPERVGRALRELGGRQGVTLFMTLLGGFQILLGRYTGRTDVAVGTPVVGRTRQETEDLLGFFVNNLVLRNDLRGDASFTEFLGQVREVVLGAFANQEVPFEHLVDELRPDRDLSRNPLFQIMFELQHLERMPTTLGGSTIEPVPTGTPVAKFDLTLSVEQHADDRLRCHFEFSTGLFDRDRIARMAGHFLRLLTCVAEDPTVGIGRLELLTEPERRLLLDEWPDPEATRVEDLDPPEEHSLTVPALFERQAVRTPDATAVVFGERHLTYAELNTRANRLAHRLRALGVGPETVVGSCLERGMDAVIALLAVLKAGGVYVPFDVAQPAERLAFMLADSGAVLTLTTRAFAARITAGGRVVVVDEDHGDETENPRPVVLPGNLAYVIYTSGSTGRPKGVMIQHRSYAHHCRVIADAYGIGPDDRVVLLSALTFDVAMDQIAATLLAGATVVVSDPVFWTPAELPARLAEHRVTIMEITPAYYRAMLESGVDQLHGLRLMNVGSDVVTVADAQRWAATGLPARFLCNYGPTEATVTCVLHPVDDTLDLSRPTAALPIGRPVAGTSTYVLDADLRPVPVGVPGELFLGGERLARGYHNRPGLTAERFVPDPMGISPGSRLYRTGDLVRHRGDGTIEFLGRLDHQVKVRGFRIELGEIEAAVATHPAVRDVIVTAREFGTSDKRIAAYLVGVPGELVDVADLRAHLRERLPDYMVPAHWTVLDEFPLTTSGKVDRTALPDPTLTPPDSAAHEAPRTPGEEVVAGIWCAVLGVPRVGRQDGFFALGGHSLLATRVLAGLREAFDVDLPLRVLFEASTVAELAAVVADAVADDIARLSDSEVAELLSQEGAR